MKRLTIEFIKSEFAREGYKLLAREYRNNKQKLEFICPSGHKHEIKWNSWQQGCRCAACGGKLRKRISEIEREFASEGYNLLTFSYINNKQKLEYLCTHGHRSSIAWSDWKSGYRCAECAGLKKYSLKEVRKAFEQENYKLIVSEYLNANAIMKYECPNGHISQTSWHDWKRGTRCKACYHNSRIKNINDIAKFQDFKQLVVRLTNYNFSKYYYLINPLNLKRGDRYHLDHIYSIYNGFTNEIPAIIISNPFNLQMLSSKDNIVKGYRSVISLGELYERYNAFRQYEKGSNLY